MVDIVSMHNDHTLCKSSARNIGFWQTLFDALFNEFRQFILVWGTPLLIYGQFTEIFEAIDECSGTQVFDSVTA
jgi:hypothetical protein